MLQREQLQLGSAADARIIRLPFMFCCAAALCIRIPVPRQVILQGPQLYRSICSCSMRGFALRSEQAATCGRVDVIHLCHSMCAEMLQQANEGSLPGILNCVPLCQPLQRARPWSSMIFRLGLGHLQWPAASPAAQPCATRHDPGGPAALPDTPPPATPCAHALRPSRWLRERLACMPEAS